MVSVITTTDPPYYILGSDNYHNTSTFLDIVLTVETNILDTLPRNVTTAGSTKNAAIQLLPT